MLLQVRRPKTTLVSEYHRVIWCPYIPDDADDSSATDSSNQDSASRVLVLTNDEQVQGWELFVLNSYIWIICGGLAVHSVC